MELELPDKKKVVRCVSSTIISVPARKGLDGYPDSPTNLSRPRTNTGSHTPTMFGLGVPTEKVPATGHSLKPRESAQCLLPQQPLPSQSLPVSGLVTPAILLTPAQDSAHTSPDLLSAASSFLTDNRNLSVLREDLVSTPLETTTPRNIVYTSSEHEDISPVNPPSILIGRSRRNTISTDKSVNFESGPTMTAEALQPPVLRVLDIKTTDFDPDPVFHRSINSPVVPEPQVCVEQVGAFRVTNLRNDSMGNLPKMFPTSSDDEVVEGGGKEAESVMG